MIADGKLQALEDQGAPLERLQKHGLRWLTAFAHERHNPRLEAEGFVWRVVQQER
jgi:hypothetical protein